MTSVPEREFVLLTKALDIASTEMNLYTTILHNQTRNGYVALSAAVAVLAILNSPSLQQMVSALVNAPPQTGLQSIGSPTASILVVSGLALIALGVLVNTYLMQRVTAIMFMIFALAAYRAALEDRLNDSIGRKVLVWDSIIMSRVRSLSLSEPMTIFSTDMLSGLLRAVVYLSTNLTLIYIGYIVSNEAGPWIVIGVTILSVVTLLEYTFSSFISRSRVGVEISRAYSQDPSYSSLTANIRNQNIMMDRSILLHNIAWMQSNQIFTLIMTFVLGVFPIIILSISEHAFWPTDPVDFPLTTVLSVALSDVLLYPFLNVYIFTLSRRLQYRPGPLGYVAMIACTAAIVLAQITIHASWAQDQHTSFMDSSPGVLTAAGMWHLTYSIVQMLIVAWFVWLSVPASRDLRPPVLRPLIYGWICLIAICFVGLVDTWLKWRRVYPTLSLPEFVRIEWYWVAATVAVIIAFALLRARTHDARGQLSKGSGAVRVMASHVESDLSRPPQNPGAY